MKRLGIGFISLILVSFLAVGILVGQAQADILIMYSEVEYSGGTPPESTTTPWVTASFVDTGANTVVRLTMSADNLTGDEFISKLNFNFDPALDPSDLDFTYVSGTEADKIVTKLNSIKAGGSGLYDISFAFPTKGNNVDRFEAGDVSVYEITYTNTLNVSAFNFVSQPEHGGNGLYYSSAHIQGISDSSCRIKEPSCESGWIGAYNIDLLSDRDFDGVPDVDDNCPDDPDKIDPGICGCGTSDTDSDGDGIADCIDPYYEANLFNVEHNHFYQDIYASAMKWLNNFLKTG